MPPLEKPDNPPSIPLPPRTAPVAATCDVLVVGGGPAGIGASIGAAKTGAHTILVERYGFLGGAATAGLVNPLMSAHTMHPRERRRGIASFYPTDHGHGTRIIAGVLLEIVNRLVESGGAIPPTIETGYVVPFDSESFKLLAMDMIDEAGVDVLLHSFASSFIDDPQYPSVIFETKSGPVAIRAHTIIDCTGDGDVAALAGAPFEIGRPEDGLVQPMTLYFRMSQFDRDHFMEYVKKHPDQWYGVHGLWDLITKATDNGHYAMPREDLLMFATPHEGELSLNSTRVNRVLGTDVFDLTAAEWEGRLQLREVISFLKKYVPGFESAYNIESGTQIAVRESRRIIGEYVLTGEDVRHARKFEDVVARCSYPLDIHDPEGLGTRLERLPPGEHYDIPLRALIPKKCKRLLVAGRCISGTHEAHSSYRIIPAAVATGQAAGVCAALSADKSCYIQEVDFRHVQKELIHQGASVD